MGSAEAALREEILRSNHALRDWAAGLRARSSAARGLAQNRRRVSSLLDVDGRIARQVERREMPQDRAEVELPSLGTVLVSDLFVILVDQHGFSVLEAVRALATGLVVAGYPADYGTVSAPDALDIIQSALKCR